MTHIHYLLARKAWRHFCWALYVVSHLNDEIFCYCINWRELREFLYLKYADTFGSRRTSSSVCGSPRKCWNNRELLENGQKLYGLFGFHFFSFWKIIYCYSEFFSVTRYRAKKLLSSYPHSDPPLTELMTKLYQNIVKGCGSTRAVSASEAKLPSFVSNVWAVSTLCTFSSSTNGQN